MIDATNWGATPAERAAAYPCDAHAPDGATAYFRAVDVATSAAVAFRWLCQLKVAPYSYDLVDNLGRRSPRTLTPGADRLEVGQPFLVFTLVDFGVNEHLTMTGLPGAERLFGPLAITYAIRPHLRSTRLVVKLLVGRAGPLGELRRYLLGWGDLVMMRKQLLTLKELAERTPDGRSAGASDPSGFVPS